MTVKIVALTKFQKTVIAYQKVTSEKEADRVSRGFHRLINKCYISSPDAMLYVVIE